MVIVDFISLSLEGLFARREKGCSERSLFVFGVIERILYTLQRHLLSVFTKLPEFFSFHSQLDPS